MGKTLEGATLVTTHRDGRRKLHYLNPVPIAADDTILEAERPNRLVFSFQARWSQELVDEGPVRMTWLVEAAGEGTSRLTVTSEGMGPRTAQEFTGGIPAITAGFKTLLETGEMLVLAPA